MAVKSERITILGSRDFKSFLNKEAAKERISVSEKKNLNEGIRDAESVLKELRASDAEPRMKAATR